MRGTLLALEPMAKTLHHTLVSPKYYYWQLASGHIAGGGSVDDLGFERGVDTGTVAAIREEMEQLIPAAIHHPPVCSWSGFRPYSEDLLPVIGPVPREKGVFVAAGHFKKGVMLAPVTGKIMADLVTQGTTGLPIEPLSPARF
jgi:glycine/D-amino acid oxidase-like deaminating enzyme